MKAPTISVIYRCEVEVPDEVYEAFGHKPEYDRFSCELSFRLGVASGSMTYSDTIEWAEGSDRSKVEEYGRCWQTQIAVWETKLKEAS